MNEKPWHFPIFADAKSEAKWKRKFCRNNPHLVEILPSLTWGVFGSLVLMTSLENAASQHWKIIFLLELHQIKWLQHIMITSFPLQTRVCLYLLMLPIMSNAIRVHYLILMVKLHIHRVLIYDPVLAIKIWTNLLVVNLLPMHNLDISNMFDKRVTDKGCSTQAFLRHVMSKFMQERVMSKQETCHPLLGLVRAW